MWHLVWLWSSRVSLICSIDWAMMLPPLSRHFSNFVESEIFAGAIPISAPCLDRLTIQCVHRCPCYPPSYEFCQSHIHRMPIQRLQREIDYYWLIIDFDNSIFSVLTVISWIVIHWAWQLYRLQIWHNFICTTLIQAFAQRKHINLLELLEQSRRWLMNCTNYGASLARQMLQQSDHLVTGVAIETTVECTRQRRRLKNVHWIPIGRRITLTSLAHLKTSQLGYLLVPVLSKAASSGRQTNDSSASVDGRTDRAMLEFLQSGNGTSCALNKQVHEENNRSNLLWLLFHMVWMNFPA